MRGTPPAALAAALKLAFLVPGRFMNSYHRRYRAASFGHYRHQLGGMPAIFMRLYFKFDTSLISCFLDATLISL